MNCIIVIRKHGRELTRRVVNNPGPGDIEKAISDALAEVRKSGESIFDCTISIEQG